MMMMNEKSSSRYPFTASQWQELEHQALIYKYMVSGSPIPPDLIIPIRRSFLLESAKASPSLSFSPQAQLGWSCFQAGYGRKAEDPEPGRCRRTDGKKWRCSKEAYPDSKYCERHMHRGKNRSRKPVEISLSSNTQNSSSSSFPANLSYPYPNASSLLHMDPLSYSMDRDYRMKDLEGCSFFSESSLQLKPLGTSSMVEGKQSGYCLSKEEEEERQRPLRHFFDEWPQKNKESWMELEDENGSYSKTQLSISFPKWFLRLSSHS
ncbi:Growth-regulating factor 1 [Apostasia shenzhenica]|uniref:Growth-regulating factor n=1 Tax=Apostasia shenzhenica TaxID=1088818 RepID=A0A2H9ZUR0_9ASPA|nr:Growth-regulating factor 1 [Apostasia shenzhenica]